MRHLLASTNESNLNERAKIERKGLGQI